MKHAKTIMALGIAVTLLPFLGFPSSWKNIIFAVCGSGIVVLAYRVVDRTARATTSPDTKDEYKDHAALHAEMASAQE